MVDDARLILSDPSMMTTAQLDREIKALRSILETRLDGNDKAIIVLQNTVDRQPTPLLVQAAVEHLEELTAEKFAAIQTQFKERDTRTDLMSQATKTAVDAALQAQKEAAHKQNEANDKAMSRIEGTFTKQMDATAAIISTGNAGLNTQILDIKERITVIESRGQGIADQKTNTRDVWGYVFGAIGMIIGVGGLIIALARFSTGTP